MYFCLTVSSQQLIHNEQQLLQQIAAGDEQAFNTFYSQHWPKVYSYLESIVKSPEAAEELLVDIFVKIWTGRQWLAQVENPGAFLRTAARNKALDFLKITSREKARISTYQADMAMQLAQQPADRITDAELKKIWHDAVSQLSPQRQKIFLMHREEGLSYQEIATQLNISPATVKKTMFLALDSIREFLRNHYKESLAAFLLFIRF